MCLDDASDHQKEEFLHEIEQMKLLGSHQNIVSLVGCCTLREHKFLVIEYVPFGDLLQWLRLRRRSVRRFPKKYLNNLILPPTFGSNGFHDNSEVFLHEIVRCNYTKLLPTYQSSQFNTQLYIGLSMALIEMCLKKAALGSKYNKISASRYCSALMIFKSNYLHV